MGRADTVSWSDTRRIARRKEANSYEKFLIKWLFLFFFHFFVLRELQISFRHVTFASAISRRNLIVSFRGAPRSFVYNHSTPPMRTRNRSIDWRKKYRKKQNKKTSEKDRDHRGSSREIDSDFLRLRKKKIHANLPEEVGTDRVAYDGSKYLRSTPLCTHQYSNTGDRYAHIRYSSSPYPRNASREKHYTSYNVRHPRYSIQKKIVTNPKRANIKEIEDTDRFEDELEEFSVRPTRKGRSFRGIQFKKLDTAN